MVARMMSNMGGVSSALLQASLTNLTALQNLQQSLSVWGPAARYRLQPQPTPSTSPSPSPYPYPYLHLALLAITLNSPLSLALSLSPSPYTLTLTVAQVWGPERLDADGTPCSVQTPNRTLHP